MSRVFCLQGLSGETPTRSACNGGNLKERRLTGHDLRENAWESGEYPDGESRSLPGPGMATSWTGNTARREDIRKRGRVCGKVLPLESNAFLESPGPRWRGSKGMKERKLECTRRGSVSKPFRRCPQAAR